MLFNEFYFFGRRIGWRRGFAVVIPALLSLLLAAGCRSTGRHHEIADRQVRAITERLGKAALGREEAYDFSVPDDNLRRRLLIEQRLPTRKPLESSADAGPGEPLAINMTDALGIGARHSPEYQNRKEAIFRAALNLDIESEEFRTSWAGVLSGTYLDDQSSDPALRGLAASAEPAVSRLFTIGASVTARLAFDLARLLTLDRDTAYGLLADASITIPLLQGAGRKIVMEPLTLAERQVIYAMYDFERYKRTFAVRVASDYLAVLERKQQIANAEDNYRRLELSTRRAEHMADAGRLPATQVDQTRQDLLRARERLINTRQEFQRRLDDFKRTIGLPADAEIHLDETDLRRLEASAALDEHEDKPDTAPPDWDLDPEWRGMKSREIIELTLDNRLDLRRLEGRMEDARRAVDVAADRLKGGLRLEGGASYGGRRDVGSADRGDVRIRPDEGRYRAILRLEAPWNRVRERNRYRESLLDLERAKRDYMEQEDAVKQQIRDGLRGLSQAFESRRIQRRAVELAERRVASTDLFLQAGRAQIRDVLEAQEALVSARNALLAAEVRYQTTEWGLQRDMDLLQITDEGLWDAYENE